MGSDGHLRRHSPPPRTGLASRCTRRPTRRRHRPHDRRGSLERPDTSELELLLADLDVASEETDWPATPEDAANLLVASTLMAVIRREEQALRLPGLRLPPKDLIGLTSLGPVVPRLPDASPFLGAPRRRLDRVRHRAHRRRPQFREARRLVPRVHACTRRSGDDAVAGSILGDRGRGVRGRVRAQEAHTPVDRRMGRSRQAAY